MSQFVVMKIYKTKKHLTEALEILSKDDKKLAAAFAKYGTPPLRKTPDGFTGLARLLIGQQVSTAAATAILGRFKEAMGSGEGDMRPENMLALSDEALAACGISRPKQRYLRGIAQTIVSDGLDLVALRKADDAVIYDTLIAMKGVGPWTAQCYLLFALGRADMFPAGDLALQHGVRLMYGLDEKPSADELDAFAMRWQPYRGAAARLLWTFYNGELAKKRTAKTSA